MFVCLMHSKPNARFAVEGLFVKQPTEGWEDKPQIYSQKTRGLGYSWDKAEVWWKAMEIRERCCDQHSAQEQLLSQGGFLCVFRKWLCQLWEWSFCPSDVKMSSSRHSCISRWRVFIGCSSNQTQPASSKSQKQLGQTLFASFCKNSELNQWRQVTIITY